MDCHNIQKKEIIYSLAYYLFPLNTNIPHTSPLHLFLLHAGQLPSSPDRVEQFTDITCYLKIRPD